MNRRDFIKSSSLTLGSAALSGCAGKNEMALYNKTARKTRASLDSDPDLRDMIRYATLAANGHNAQPWKFRIHKSTVEILPDFSRRTPVADPDDHHLFASLGCASENLAIAAEACGRPAEIRFNPVGSGRISIDLSRGNRYESGLFKAIPYRQCTRSEYNGDAVRANALGLLEKAATAVEGIQLILITEEKEMETVLDYVIAGSSAQIDDPAFVEEL